ncbi:MAG: proline dehydrogenase family protein [Candidatus Nanopelagicales bacterium]
MLRRVVSKVGRAPVARRVVTSTPGLRETTRRFVGGEDAPSAVITAEALHEQGLRSTLHLRAGDVHTAAEADEHVRAYAELATRLSSAGCGPASEISVKMAQLGLYAPGGWHGAVARLREVVAQAAERGLFVTMDMEGDHEVDQTLSAVHAVREEHPSLGIALQAYLRRTEDDCRMLAHAGSRVRLVKGAYGAGSDIAFTTPEDVDAAFLRCLSILMDGQGYPMVASHDMRMIDAARRLARESGRRSPEWELQMLLGVRSHDQRALAAEGLRVRVYVPYGPEWYGWFVNRIAEKPANLRLLAHALLSRDEIRATEPV